ncbi:MAG: hypothetical protein PHS54_05365 [Clostridia bacterium]|nr:hypothetical protein [Clostridia bacterium]
MDFNDFLKGFESFNLENSKYIEWLDDIREKDNDLFLTIKEIMPIFFEYSKNTKYPKTTLALLSFQTHLSTIKNAIIDLSEENNIYSIKALYRILLEHLMKGVYIWSRYLKEKNDEVGIEYNNLMKIGENLKYGNSIKQLSIILDAETKNMDVWDTLCKYDNNLKKMNKKDITNIISKFDYKNIAKYLIDNKTFIHDLVPTIISEYSELSSFVHGGPNAVDEYSSTLYNKQFEEYKGMIRFALNMCQIFSFSVFAIMVKDVNDEQKEKLMPLLSKLQKRSNFV